jgi:uncharacterized membrane protein
MTTANVFAAFLTLHLISLVIMAGTTLIDFISYQTYWKLFDQNGERAAGILEATSKFPRLIGIGAAFLVVSGVGMIALTHGLLAEQLWFKIKFTLVIVLVTNGILVGARNGIKLRKAVAINGPELKSQIVSIKTNLRRFHITQLIIFCTIIILSAYKFN